MTILVKRQSTPGWLLAISSGVRVLLSVVGIVHFS